jgi:hypothetical protein
VKRRLFTVIAGVSLVLAFVVCIQWYRGYQIQDHFSIERYIVRREHPTQEQFGVVCCQGAFWFSAVSQRSDSINLVPRSVVEWQQQLGLGWRVRIGTYTNSFYPSFRTGWINRFGFHASRDNSAVNVLIPMWFSACCTFALPVAWILFARSRVLRGHYPGAKPCPRCGYDLRATLDRCPECGKSAEKTI